jgi:hypothetical protein
MYGVIGEWAECGGRRPDLRSPRGALRRLVVECDGCLKLESSRAAKLVAVPGMTETCRLVPLPCHHYLLLPVSATRSVNHLFNSVRKATRLPPCHG